MMGKFIFIAGAYFARVILFAAADQYGNINQLGKVNQLGMANKLGMENQFGMASKFGTANLLFEASDLSAQGNQKKAPNVRLVDLDGKRVQLKSYLGMGPVIINFWATWCKPCQEEMEELQKMHDSLSSRGLKIISISVDDERSAGKVKPWVKSKNYDFLFLLDINSDAARDFYVQEVPNSFLVDVNGNIVYSHRGFRKGDEVEMLRRVEEEMK